MKTIYIAFSDGNRLTTIFGGPLPEGANFPGYVELEIDDDVVFANGDYYNAADGKFYADAAFLHLSGWINPDDVYRSMLATLRTNVFYAIESIRGPYTDYELASLPQQEMEASTWSADNTYTPPLLTGISTASGVALSDLVTSVTATAADWKSASGNIYGQARAKAIALETLRQEAIAGTKTVADIQAYNVSILAPSLVLS